MKNKCLNCENIVPKHGMKTCSRKCADEQKTKQNSWNRKCLECQIDFTTRNSDKKVLCSEECRKNWVSRPENINDRIEKSKEAIKEKFGVDNVFQLDVIKTKSKETKKEIYGDENYNNGQQGVKTKKEKYGEDYYHKLMEERKEIFIEKYGVSHHLKLQEFKDKQKKTVQERYGVDYVSQNTDIKNKRDATIKEIYGVDNISQNEDIKKKKAETSFKNFGVTHHLKDYNRLQKHLKISYKIKEYKDTKLNYQGSYELYFLELMEAGNKLKEVQDGHSFKYEFAGINHTYHTDYFVRGENIEIKSGWTYNNNGVNDILEAINHVKWESVLKSGEKIRILKSKQEILDYVISLI